VLHRQCLGLDHRTAHQLPLRCPDAAGRCAPAADHCRRVVIAADMAGARLSGRTAAAVAAVRWARWSRTARVRTARPCPRRSDADVRPWGADLARWSSAAERTGLLAACRQGLPRQVRKRPQGPPQAAVVSGCGRPDGCGGVRCPAAPRHRGHCHSLRVSAATGTGRLAGGRWWDAASATGREPAARSGGRGAGRGGRSSPAG
jgi:hypothetical protein